MATNFNGHSKCEKKKPQKKGVKQIKKKIETKPTKEKV